MTHRTRAAILAAVTCVLVAATCATTAWSLDEYEFKDKVNFPVGDEFDLSVETIAGNITYTGSNTETAVVSMTVVVRADDEDEAQEIRDAIDIQIDNKKGLLDIYVDRPNEFYNWLRREFGKDRTVWVNIEIDGPRGAKGELATVSGDVTVSNTKDMLVSTVSGDIQAEGINGRARLKSVSGEIDLDGCTGRAQLGSVSGSLTAKNCRDDLSASTTSGDIRVSHESGDLDLSSVSGDVEARSSTDGEVSIETVSGTVEIAVDENKVGDVDIESFSGDIETNADLRVRRGGRRKLIGSLGAGSGRLEIETHSGDIILSSL